MPLVVQFRRDLPRHPHFGLLHILIELSACGPWPAPYVQYTNPYTADGKLCEKVLASINFKLKDVYNDILSSSGISLNIFTLPSQCTSVCVMKMTSFKYIVCSLKVSIREIGEFD